MVSYLYIDITRKGQCYVTVCLALKSKSITNKQKAANKFRSLTNEPHNRHQRQALRANHPPTLRMDEEVTFQIATQWAEKLQREMESTVSSLATSDKWFEVIHVSERSKNLPSGARAHRRPAGPLKMPRAQPTSESSFLDARILLLSRTTASTSPFAPVHLLKRHTTRVSCSLCERVRLSETKSFAIAGSSWCSTAICRYRRTSTSARSISWSRLSRMRSSRRSPLPSRS